MMLSALTFFSEHQILLIFVIIFWYAFLDKFEFGRKLLHKVDQISEVFNKVDSKIKKSKITNNLNKIFFWFFMSPVVLAIIVVIWLVVEGMLNSYHMTKELNEVYQKDIVRVWYSTDQKFRINLTDKNDNGTPDQVEDAALQVEIARFIFHKLYRYPDPLESTEYRDVKYIDIYLTDNIRKRSFDDDKGKALGVASRMTRPVFKWFKTRRALKMYIVASSIYDKSNEVVIHEYFHFIQFGMFSSMSYDDWIIEGLARWSEDALSNDKSFYKKTLTRDELLAKLNDPKTKKLGYSDAVKAVWAPFINLCGEKEKFQVPTKLRYLNGQNPFKDDAIYGAELIREFMKRTSQKTDIAQQTYREKRRPTYIRTKTTTHVPAPDSDEIAKEALIEMLNQCASRELEDTE